MKLLNGIGLGTFPFANPFTKVSKDKAAVILDTYLTNEGQYIDTAPTYAFGEVERLLSELLKSYNRDKFFICSSCGYVKKDDSFVVSGKFQDVIDDCNESLKRLGISSIDLYISHIPDQNTPFSETVQALVQLKKDGKIKHIGVSNVTLDQLKEYNETKQIEYVQNRFSLLNQSFNHEFIEYCKENNIGIIAYQVIERGLLTNKVINGINLREEDLRNRKPEFKPEIKNTIMHWVKEYLEPIANDLKTDISSIAIWWALQQPYIALCQCGATNESQVINNLKATSLGDSIALMDKINLAYKVLESKIRKDFNMSIREFMGLESYNLYSGSASGK